MPPYLLWVPIKSIISGIHEANIAYKERRIKNIRNKKIRENVIFLMIYHRMVLLGLQDDPKLYLCMLSELISKLSKLDKGMASIRRICKISRNIEDPGITLWLKRF